MKKVMALVVLSLVLATCSACMGEAFVVPNGVEVVFPVEDERLYHESILNPYSGYTAQSVALLPEGITHVVLPLTVVDYQGYMNIQVSETLEFIEVPQDHPTLSSDDGLLYSKDGETLLLVPPRYAERTFVIPEGAKTHDKQAFLGISDYCETLELPSSYEEFPIFTEIGNFKYYQVAIDNPYFCTIEGVLFSKDKETLINYPYSRYETYYEVPEGVRILGEDAMLYAGGYAFECEKMYHILRSHYQIHWKPLSLAH